MESADWLSLCYKPSLEHLWGERGVYLRLVPPNHIHCMWKDGSPKENSGAILEGEGLGSWADKEK